MLATALSLAVPSQVLVRDAAGIEAEIHRTGSVVLHGITFDPDQATLQSGSALVLVEIVKLMKDRTDWRFEVQAHTDHSGAKGTNLTLSQQRAASVVEWLTKNGIDAGRLVGKGYGDTAPLSDDTSEQGRARNRRIELKKLNEE